MEKSEKKLTEAELNESLNTDQQNQSDRQLQSENRDDSFAENNLKFAQEERQQHSTDIQDIRDTSEDNLFEPQIYHRQTLVEQVLEYEQRINNQAQKSKELQQIDEENIIQEQEFKKNLTNYLGSDYAQKCKPTFTKDFNEAMNGGFAQDLKLAVTLEKLRHSKKISQIFRCCGSIFVPMLITGMENFKSNLDIKGCTNAENDNIQPLSRCIWCNGQQAQFNVGGFYQFFVYSLWLMMGFFCVYIFIINLRYSRFMNSLNPYGIKVVGTFSQSIKSHKFQFTAVVLAILIGTVSTRIFRDIILSFTRDIDCEYTDEDTDELVKLTFNLELKVNSYSTFQYVVAIIISIIFYTEAFVLIFDKSASPISILITSSDLFNRDYNENLEYLTYRLRGITKQINIHNFYKECNLSIEDAGYSKFQVIFLKQIVFDAIVLVMVYRIEKNHYYDDIDKTV